MKYLKKNWLVLKTIGITSMVYILIIAIGAFLLLWRDNAEITEKLENCQRNYDNAIGQVESGRIVLDLEK